MLHSKLKGMVWLLGVLLLILLLATAENAGAAYLFSNVDYPGASWTVASGINDSGQIVGYYNDASGVRHGFLFSAGTYTTIDCTSPYTSESIAAGVNSSGQIVGFCSAPGGVNGVYGTTRSFLMTGGVLTFLPDVAGSYNGASTFAQAINDTGQVVGWYADACLCEAHGFLLNGGTYTTLDVPGFGSTNAYGINNSGQITGGTQPGFGTGGVHGFLLSGGSYTMIDDPDTGTSSGTTADSINSSGKIAGYYSDGAKQHGFLLDGGVFTTVDHPNALGAGVQGINSQGQLVGAYTDLTNVLHGFVTTTLDASLVSYWPLDYGSALDLVGGNNGATTNTTAIVGRVDGALHFDGTDSIVTTPYTPSLDVSKMTQLTAETWARFSQNPPVVETFLTLMGKFVANGPWSFLLVVRQHPALNVGQPFFTSYLCNSQQCLVGEEAAPYANVPSDMNWHHVAQSYDSATGTVNLYVDGALARTWTLSPGVLVNDPNFGIQIGSFSPPGNPFYTNPFDLDEVALWRRALSASEILCHYQAGLAGKNYFTCPTPTQVASTVSFTGAPASAAYGATFNVSATTNASTTASITASGPCSISGTVVTITTGTGTCSLSANWAADSNYLAASLSQSTTAAPAPLVITVANATKILNAPNPSLNNITYSGFVFSDGSSSLGGTLTCTTTASTTSPVGSYPITCSGLTSSNYAISYTAGTLKILYSPAGGTCDGDLSHTILQPVNADGTSVWKQGRTIPLKFRVCDANGVSVGSVGVISGFALTQIISGTVANVDETIDANVIDSGFRFDTSAQQWIFNLSTKGENAGYTYVYTISLNDGTSITFQYGLR